LRLLADHCEYLFFELGSIVFFNVAARRVTR
jgi:hypothetical protein